MTTRPPFPLVWDNTMRTSFVACPRKFAWEHLDHYKPVSPSVHLHAGAAWAKALEVLRAAYYCGVSMVGRRPSGAHPYAEKAVVWTKETCRDHDEELALELAISALAVAYGSFDCPPDSAKSANRLAEALVYYLSAFPLATDPAQPYVGATGPMIEFSFALPFDDNLRHPETGEPIIYAGRADMVATFAGAVSIYDDKTTSALGATWFNQWDMRSQFTGYSWAADMYGIPARQILVRGISILKTKINHAQALSDRPDWRRNRWHKQVGRDIRRAIACWQEGYWDYSEADACTHYGGCIFKMPCSSQDPEPWLRGNFARRVWDPVARTEDSVAELPEAPHHGGEPE